MRRFALQLFGASLACGLAGLTLATSVSIDPDGNLALSAPRVSLALADRVQVPGGGPWRGHTQLAPVVLRYLAGTFATGARMPEDANVVSHVLFTGATNGIVDENAAGTVLNTWQPNGSVPETSDVPWINGAKYGAGPFATGNYFSIAASASLSPATFTVCFAFDPTSVGTIVLASDGSLNTDGWYMENGGGNLAFVINKAGASASETIGGLAQNSPNVACASYDGTNVVVTDNGTTTGTTTFAGFVPHTSGSLYLGVYNGSAPWLGQIYEMYYTSTALTTGPQYAIEKRYLGMLGTAGEPLTVTRATTATDDLSFGSCASPPCVYTWPANVGRVDSRGLLVEPVSTNLALYSEQFDNAAWTATNTTVTANTTKAPDGNTTADTLTSTVGGGKVESSTTTATATIYTASVWVFTSSVNQSFDLRIRDTTGGTDYVACNGETATATPLTRFTCSGSGNATAGHALAIDIYPGQSTGTGTIIAWGAQLEAQPFATSYIPTTSAAVTRNMDFTYFSNPASIGPYFSASWDIWRHSFTFGNAIDVRQQTSPYDASFLTVDDGSANDTYFVGTAPCASVAATLDVSQHEIISFDGSTGKIALGAATASCTVSPNARFQWPINFGNNEVASAPIDGWLANLCLGITPGACN